MLRWWWVLCRSVSDTFALHPLLQGINALEHQDKKPKDNRGGCQPLECRKFEYRTQQHGRCYRIFEESKQLHSANKRHRTIILSTFNSSGKQKKAGPQALSNLQSRLIIFCISVTAANHPRRRWCSPDAPRPWAGCSEQQLRNPPRSSASHRYRPSRRARHPGTS